MNRRKVRVVANQPKTLEAIFNPERTGRNKNKKRNSNRRDGKREGSICNKQWKGGGKTGRPGVRKEKRLGGGGGTESSHSATQCLHCRWVGSGWSVIFFLLALGHEFKSHTGFKPRADFAVALPLCAAN